MDVNSQENLLKIIGLSLEVFPTIANYASNQDPKLSTMESNRERMATRSSKSAANAYAYLSQVIAHEYIEHKYKITEGIIRSQ